MKQNTPSRTDVLLLAAGYGARLKPLTDTKPKPLIEVGGKPLIDWNLEMLSRAGFKRVFVNVHYLAEKIIEHLGDGAKWNLQLNVIKEPVLLDTGGAIKNIEDKLESDALVTVNSDILIGQDFSFEQLFKKFDDDNSKPIATLAVRHDALADSYGALEINEAGRICSFCGRSYVLENNLDKVMYLGIQVLSREVLASMPKRGSIDRKSTRLNSSH